MSEPTRANVVVLASGSGSLAQALIDAAAGEYPARVVALISDRADAQALDRARAGGIATEVVAFRADDRAAWDHQLAGAVSAYAPDWVVSAGFMRLLGPAMLSAFPQRIINTHPALLPAFPGAHGVRDALRHGVRVTGATVHLIDSGTDTGPILDQRAVLVADDDDECSLHERIKQVERVMVVEMVARLAQMTRSGAHLTLRGRKVLWT